MKTEIPVLALSSRQLRAAANLREKIDRYQTKLVFTLNLNGAMPPPRATAEPALGRPKKRRMSAAGRARLSDLAKARWRKQRRLGKRTL
jgi:hypothetical protein